MRKRMLVLFVLLGVLTVLMANVAVAQEEMAQEGMTQEPPAAMAVLQDNEGNPVGTAEFLEVAGGVTITVSVDQGVEPGEHGIHIHEKADLSSSDFESAGDHFNPTNAEHGLENPNGPHAGDLENIVVAEDGTASYGYSNNRITLSAGPNTILDGDGSALIIHSMPDDNTTDDDPETGPGMTGDRIAAGEIVAVDMSDLSMTGGPIRPDVLLLVAGVVVLSLAAGTVTLVSRLRHRA